MLNINDQMLSIAAGKIDLRDDRKKSTWTVEINSFLLSKFPITQDLGSPSMTGAVKESIRMFLLRNVLTKGTLNAPISLRTYH